MAPGWIFGRGDCGCNRGPGLEELIEGVKPNGESSVTSKTFSKNSSKATETSKSSKTKTFFKETTNNVKKLAYILSKKKHQYVKSDEEPVSSGEEEALMLR